MAGPADTRADERAAARAAASLAVGALEGVPQEALRQEALRQEDVRQEDVRREDVHREVWLPEDAGPGPAPMPPRLLAPGEVVRQRVLAAQHPCQPARLAAVAKPAEDAAPARAWRAWVLRPPRPWARAWPDREARRHHRALPCLPPRAPP
ncbi:hypothetical protein DGI_2867 [Megalodesulfovibrio gigas DSM 1382 = ATCC 19364]|uniref:Uncharacterized protein n=1 Tax=Megalodesulfovibrio gigas (strain ATCC 19364 / DSM 1382 / NCIMB 9332 / VKM B-1759) TaxID=1121448 RepID=T2GEL7_MEGG1|nr:hypothetical protein DGI_2867 [Megalodesulfovibrio gigas DSM 1382 = ATCC 19364]